MSERLEVALHHFEQLKKAGELTVWEDIHINALREAVESLRSAPYLIARFALSGTHPAVTETIAVNPGEIVMVYSSKRDRAL